MRQRKVKFFALFPCFFPDAVDAPVRGVSFGRKKSGKDKTVGEVAESPETETIKSQTHVAGVSTSSSADDPAGKSSPSSLSEIEEAKTPPEVLTDAAASKVREVYKKSKKPNSDVTNAMSAELRTEDEAKGENLNVNHKKGLSCHPVLMEEWNLVTTIPSDNEEGEGHTSDYEC